MLTPRRKVSKYHHGDLMSATLQISKKMVATGGIHSLGIRKIADSLNVTPAALYRHFSNLDQIRAELGSAIRNELGEFMLESLSPVPPKSKQAALKRLETIGTAYVEFAINNPRLFEIAFMYCDEDPITEYEDIAWNLLTDCVSDLVKTGVIDRDELDSKRIFLWSSIHGIATLVSQGAIASVEKKEFYEIAVKELIDSLKIK